MSFELPLTALAMEIAGTAARAVGAGQTLTFPAPLEADERMLAAIDATAAPEATVAVGVAAEFLASLTITL